MDERVRDDVSDGFSWYCPQCYTRKSIRDGSFFSKFKLSLQKWLLLLHYWVHQTHVTDALEDVEVDKRTAVDVYHWLREITTTAFSSCSSHSKPLASLCGSYHWGAHPEYRKLLEPGYRMR